MSISTIEKGSKVQEDGKIGLFWHYFSIFLGVVEHEQTCCLSIGITSQQTDVVEDFGDFNEGKATPISKTPASLCTCGASAAKEDLKEVWVNFFKVIFV